MDPTAIAASLWSSFSRIPPAAIPTMLDCMLTSTTSVSSSIFSALLNQFPTLTKEITERSDKLGLVERNCVVSYVAALSHLLKTTDAHQMPIFIWEIWIPLLKLVHTCDHELFNEVAGMFLDVVTETNTWEVLESTVVPLLLRSIGLSLGMFQSDESAIYRWSSISTVKELSDEEVRAVSFDNSLDQMSKMKCEDHVVSIASGFPLPVSCNILTLTLDAALCNMHAEGTCCTTSENSPQSRYLAGNILWDLSNLALQMLSTSLEHRATAIRLLLPCVFKALLRDSTFKTSVDGIYHVLTRFEYFTEVWQCCKLLFSLGSLERRDAYDILSLYLSFSSPSDDVNVCGRESLITDPKFWDEIKRGLLDKESLVRKQSLHILKTTLNLSQETKSHPGILDKVSDDNGSGPRNMGKKGKWADDEAKSLGIGNLHTHSESTNTGRQRWETFAFLYEMLEEYGTHLVEAAWNHQIMLWLQSSFTTDSLGFVNGEINRTLMDTPMQVFEWLAVLWERGFCHDNPQVRCHIMQSFLAIEWEKYGGCGILVPEDFILGPLVRGLNDPVHHREFGLKEVYSSWTIEAAAKFLREYTSSMQGRQHISFMVNLASIPKAHSLGRVGLMCLAECISSAASGLLEQTNYEAYGYFDAITKEVLDEFTQDFSKYDKSDLLDVLRFVIECSKRHFNPRYRLKVCENIVAAATTLMTATDIPLEILLNFMSCLPREYTDYGGSLRHAVQNWLRGSNLCLLKAIDDFPTEFISSQHPRDFPATYNDEELDAWVSEVKRWVRVLFLAAKEEEELNPIIKFLQDHGGDISKPKTSLECLDVKFLILVCSLVQELHVIVERTCKIEMKSKTKSTCPLPVMAHNLILKEPVICEKFTTVMLSFMEELVSCAKLAASIFWSAIEMEEKTLPGSIRGKLGGPSQRRLPSSLCTSVLKAITSLKTLSSVTRWCAQFRTDVLLNHSQTFLWNFCWRIIRSPTCKSEVEAEICIAAHEACVYVLKDLAPIFSSLSVDLFVNNDNLFPEEAGGEALLDVFVSTFMHKINNVIDGGILARTRRAVLINSKWTCLESLLRLPNYALCNGADLRSCSVYFSDTIARHIFYDLVGSLEQAGEVSILPMLRSVRLCSELLAPKRMNPQTFSCEGITIEMMWLLVQSSWILHANCNKRRVAPIAALLSCVLNTCVFGDDSMHELNGAPGPLKWFIEKILEEGTKSPRTIRLAALHLSGLWLAHPNILKYYMKELKLLTFYGSVAFDEDFEAELAENTDARTEVSMLSRSLDPELTEVFINTELYGRVSVAVLFSKLADMIDLAKSTVETEDTSAAIASGKMFLSELLDSVVNDKDLSKELYKKYSAIHRRKVRAWQMICVLSRFVDIDIVDQVTSSLHTSLYRNNLPSVRQYLETFAIHIYLKFPSLIGTQLVNFLRSYELRPQALSSYVFIAANVILNSEKESRIGHLNELLPPIIPLLTSHHHTLRGFAQILVYKVLQRLLPELKSAAWASVSLEKRCFVELGSYLEHNSDCARLRTSMDSYLDVFDPMNSISPAGIFINRVEDVDFECVQTTLMDRINDFLNNAREDLRSSMAKDAAAIKNESIHVEKSQCIGQNNPNGGESVIAQEIAYDFQKKITFSKHEILDSASTISLDDQTIHKSLAGMETEDQLLDQLLHSRGVMVEKLKASRQQIVILASLIDRIPNLAGLARTCEVFRAAGLAVADKNVINDKQFQLISVTAEKWVPVMEVPVASMKVFLEKKKQHGYAILGLEQTANSIPLDQFKFPTKTVLVLGREKEGIPVEIIHMLDGCIEIPQLGIVRSLNVHVSGAIALWEYTRQQRLLQ